MRISPVTIVGALRAPLMLAAVGIWSSVAAAGVLGTTSLALNSDGPDGGYWRGSVSFDVSPVSPPFLNDEVEGTLDWAVFAPGQFQAFLDGAGIAATDPAPGQVVYAYQVSPVVHASPGIETVTVGIDATDVVTTGPTQVLTSWAGEQAISSAFLAVDTSAVWSFVHAAPHDGETISAGEISPLLVFASPNVPQLDTFQVSSGLASFNGNTPSTMVGSPGNEPFIPEPGSLALLTIGIVGFFLSHRRSC